MDGIRSRRRRRRHYSRHQHTCRTSCVDELVHVRGGTEQHDGTCLYHSILAHDVTPPTWRGLHWFGLTRCRMLLQAVIQLISVHQGAARHCQHRYRTKPGECGINLNILVVTATDVHVPCHAFMHKRHVRHVLVAAKHHHPPFGAGFEAFC